MWGRFGRRKRRTGQGEALERALSALENVRGRYGRSRSRREGRTYDDAVGLGIGVLAMVLTTLLLFWLVRRLTRETTTAEEEGVGEDVPQEETA